MCAITNNISIFVKLSATVCLVILNHFHIYSQWRIVTVKVNFVRTKSSISYQNKAISDVLPLPPFHNVRDYT